MSETKEPGAMKNGLCQYGFSEADVALYTSLFDNYRSKLISKIFPTNAKRNIEKITCDSLKKLSKGAPCITPDVIKGISKEEFKKCTTFLGNQKWTTAQFVELERLALAVNTFNFHRK